MVQHLGQAVQRVGVVAGAGHGQHVRAADHLRLKAAGPQKRRALGPPASKILPLSWAKKSGWSANASCPKHMTFILCRSATAAENRSSRSRQRAKAAGPSAASQSVQPSRLARRRGSWGSLSRTHPAVAPPRRGRPGRVQLQKGRLGQTGQGFVGALHHRMPSGGYRAALPAVPGGKGQVVCPVGFVHQKRHIVGVTNGGNGRNIAQNALVSRAGQNYAFCLRMGGQRRFHRGGQDTLPYTPKAVSTGGGR